MDTTETAVYHAVIAAGIVSCIFIFILLFTSLWLQRKFLQNNRMKMEAEVMILEQERSRIAADLHDEVGSLLFLTKRKIEDILTTDAVSEKRLREGIELTNKVTQKMRAISLGLMPLSLAEKGLLYALEEFILPVNMDEKLRIQFSCAALPVLPEKDATHIYRIILEIIHNTLKHARATELKIEIKKKNKLLYILTADDGTGFNMEKIAASGNGYGLLTIRNRADFLNGRANVFSAVGKGCKWEVVVGDSQWSIVNGQ